MHAKHRFPLTLVALSSLYPLAAPPARATDNSSAGESVEFHGAVEAYGQLHFDHPSSGLTALRGFDSRDRTWTISNAWVEATRKSETFQGRFALQVGATGETVYAAEPAKPGGGAVNGTNADLWKHVQEAHAGHRFGASRRVLVSAGVFLSPIGPEGISVRDNWNWSRSNLFFGLPFYHTGARAAWTVNDGATLTAAVFNGWNSVVDANDEKSVMFQYTDAFFEGVSGSLLYFGGVERPNFAPEGRAWRHLFDAHATWTASPSLSVLVHADAGFEPNRFGTSSWVAGALAARWRMRETIYLAARGDAFSERAASNELGTASSIFWPADWVSSGTVTLEARPEETFSLRLELRHDRAERDVFFGGDVEGDGFESSFVPNRDSQTTLTLGTAAWF